MGRKVSPGDFMSQITQLMPLCLAADASVRTSNSCQSERCPWLVQILLPETTS